MKAPSRKLLRARRQHGFALVIILAFVVLLTAVVVAFFTTAIAKREISNSSVNQEKADVLAKSAMDIVVGNLKEEIVVGSNVATPPVVVSGKTLNIYYPKTQDNAVPKRSTTITLTTPPGPMPPVDPNPNFIRESSTTTDPYSATPLLSSLASPVNSYKDPSLGGVTGTANGGRRITPARWNSHYMIPRTQKGATIDSTPDGTANFTPPDWVLVSRGGPAVVNSLSAAQSNSDPTNANYVVGRYAYAIYDEGGMLDMNAAGYPTPGTQPSSTGFTTTQVGQKGGLALADLTQIPIVSPPPTPSSSFPPSAVSGCLPQSDVDKIINWRNYASAHSSASFGGTPSFTYSNNNDNWFSNFADTSNRNSVAASGYRSVYGSANGATDQAFTSRQQLLDLRTALNFDQNALMYMGTFSRALEQPSFVPALVKDPAAPKVLAGALDTSAWFNSFKSYRAGNNAFGGDTTINPSFLTQRVTVPFANRRLDGTQAVVGEPLVKRKFALNNLQYLTLTATAHKTAGDPIYDRFGLSRGASTDAWTYDHGLTNSTGGTAIGTLTQVAAAGREPDMAELLKAAIQCGSLGKANPGDSKANGVQSVVDNNIDNDVLQIMANLIDQYDTDGIPTRIQISEPNGVAASSAATMVTFSGDEDIPGFYRVRSYVCVDSNPTPQLGIGDQVNADGTVLFRAAPGTLDPSKAGRAVFFMIPEVWNVHDPLSSANVPATARPTQFRVWLATTDPYGGNTIKANLTGVAGGTVPEVPASIPPGGQVLTGATGGTPSTSVEYQDPTGNLYREPTMLWNTNAPPNSHVRMGDGSTYNDQNTVPVRQRCGLVLGTLPIDFQHTDSAKTITAKHYGKDVAASGGNIIMGLSQINFPGAGNWDFTIGLDYQDPTSHTWINYSKRYINQHNNTPSPSVVVDPISPSDSAQQDYNFVDDSHSADSNLNPLSNGSMYRSASAYDPRGPKFCVSNIDSAVTNSPLGTTAGALASQTMYADPFPEITATAATSAAYNGLLGKTDYTLEYTQRPNLTRGAWDNLAAIGAGYQTVPVANKDAIRWIGSVQFYPNISGSAQCWGGLMSQNNPTMMTGSFSNNSAAYGPAVPFYYEDCDGVARRAMGGYVLVKPVVGSEAVSSESSETMAGLPLATATNIPKPARTANGAPAPTQQMRSRPFILNRPFKSVGEMSYAFSGVPWKQLDFFTPESGDTALLDTFCISDPPPDAIVAGKVDLNTHSGPVLQAILAGAYRDAENDLQGANKPTWALDPLTGTEAAAVTSRLMGITLDSAAASPWHGPLTNVAELVGRYVSGPTTPPVGAVGVYTIKDTIFNKTFVYSGLPQALYGPEVSVISGATSGQVYKPDNTPADVVSGLVQRYREAAIRPLADSGQVRVWNLMIDVVAQTGHYPPSAKKLGDFYVDGEKRYWLHVAIDRMTGEVIDRQLEPVTE